MNILILVEDYPDARRSVFPFVKQLVDEMARQGHKLQVVAPYSLTHNKRICKKREHFVIGGGSVTVYRPMYITLSNFKIGNVSLSYLMLQNAFRRGLKKLDRMPDFIYGHFWHTAYCGYEYAFQNKLPLFVASGESEIDFRADSPNKRAFCDYVSGVVCVSTKNKEESLLLNLTDKSRCAIIPNAIDRGLFKVLDKKECRTKLKFPKESFIIIFVGWFINRKGTLRVSEAISGILDGEAVYSVFIGDGNEDPSCNNILFKGLVKHDDIPNYLNAADCFVLPTLQEGCCNAIVEAMACGLPIISSNLSFNMDICDKTNSILVDPNNIEEIRDAIIMLRDNKQFRKNLSEGSLKKAATLTIDNRTATIINFMKDKI